MAAAAAAVTVPSLHCRYKPFSSFSPSFFFSSSVVVSPKKKKYPSLNLSVASPIIKRKERSRRSIVVFSELEKLDSNQNQNQNRRRRRTSVQDEEEEEEEEEEEVKSVGVKAALSMLKFYKREISPLLPNSCRYVPTCSEYSMQAYQKYGVAKGTILTAWRLCRCNPLGGSGYDPPRWFGETRPPEQ